MFRSSAHFFIIFYNELCVYSLYIFGIMLCYALSVALFSNIFSHSESCPLVLFMASFVVQNLLSLNRLYFLKYFYYSC